MLLPIPIGYFVAIFLIISGVLNCMEFLDARPEDCTRADLLNGLAHEGWGIIAASCILLLIQINRQLESLRFEGSRGVLRFGLHLDGHYLERNEGHWVTVTVDSGRITGITAALRQLETGDSVKLLPTLQAAATVTEGRGAVRVRLLEQESGLFVPGICFVTEE